MTWSRTLGSLPVSKRRFETPPARRAAAPAAPRSGPIASWVRFWFTAADPVGLHTLRVLVGLLALAWLLPLAGQQEGLFGLGGWFDRSAYIEAAHLPAGPPQPLAWSVLYLCGSDATRLAAVYWASVAVLVLFTLGLWPRLLAVLSWVVVVSFTASPAVVGDVDPLLGILAFYLMVGYVLTGQRPRGQPLAARLLGPRFAWRSPAGRDSMGANVALRLLQVHLAAVVFVSGLHKLQFGDWWAGVALWYPLHPPFEMTAEQARRLAPELAGRLTVLSVAGYLTLAWQLGFPCFAWRPRWRAVLFGGAALGWLGTADVYDLPLLGPALLAGCTACLSAAEWHRLLALLARIPGLSDLRQRWGLRTSSKFPARRDAAPAAAD
jgi:hypothetical protein